MKRILIPTDFSQNARHAIDFALKLFDDESCELTLLHTFGADGMKSPQTLVWQVGDAEVEKASKDSEIELKTLRQDLIASNKNHHHQFKTVSKYNYLSDEIESQLKSGNYDLVVMGTKGSSGSREVWVGSNTVHVLDQVGGVPMLIIPEHSEIKYPGEIALAVTYKEKVPVGHMELLNKIAVQCNSDISLLHVTDGDELTEKQQSIKEEILDAIKYVKIAVYTLADEDDDAEEAIQKFVKDTGVDMIALVNRQHSFFEKMLQKSTLKGLSYHSKVPLLVL
ncbi:universal stress protein [Robertkochia solimangrovi]|uniref:universal stress protein n=1 Tax=Robertkochia solimangrovi TaxID=2213046 RepID=UPI00117DC883|nr:universal stress protein [Robertkochia solimangrovi]